MPRLKYYFNHATDRPKFVDTPPSEIVVGRDEGCEVRLSLSLVPGRAAVLYESDGTWAVEPLTPVHTSLNGRNLAIHTRQTFGRNDKLVIAQHTFEVIETEAPKSLAVPENDFFAFVQAVHELLAQDDQVRREDIVGVELQIDQLFDETLQGLADVAARKSVLEYGALFAVREELVSTLLNSSGRADFMATATWSRLQTTIGLHEQDLAKIVASLRHRINVGEEKRLSGAVSLIDQKFQREWERIKQSILENQMQYLAKRAVKVEIKNTMYGRGPLEQLWRDPAIGDIMVVSPELIFVEVNGRLEKSGRRFLSHEVTADVIKRLVSDAGRNINNRELLADASSRDGHRVNAILPPLAVSGPCLTIRKFPNRKRMSDLIATKSVSVEVAEFLRAAVMARCNIIVSGGTGSGKTTLLNCLTDSVPVDQRIVTIEDTAELDLKGEHVVRLQTKPKNAEEASLEYTIRDLVRNALRMRPDRIVVGECRGKEAIDMLQAMNTGHDGSMTTIHANSAREVVQRLEVMVQQDPEISLPVDAIHRQICSSVDLIVQLVRRSDGQRIILSVSEIIESATPGGGVETRDIFLRQNSAGTVDQYGTMSGTGRLPTFIQRLMSPAHGGLQLDVFLRTPEVAS